MKFSQLFTRSLPQPAKKKTGQVSISKETIDEWKKKAKDDIQEAHRELTSKGVFLNRWVRQVGLRPEDPGQGLRVIRLETQDVQDFLDTLANIDAELKTHQWGGYQRPSVVADLTAVELSKPVEYTYLSFRCSAVFDQTIVGANIRFDVAGDDIKIEIRNECRFDDGLRILTKDRTELQMSIRTPSFDSDISLNNHYRSTRRTKLRVDAPGVKFAGDLKIANEFDITHLDLSGAKFNEPISITSCWVSDRLQFVGAEFVKDIVFEHCDISHPPNLHNAVFRRRLAFEGCHFKAANKLFRSDCDYEDIDAYRTLRMHFAKLRNSRMEGLFFALEQRAERLLAHEDLIDRGLSWCFDALSSYGQSTSRIAAWFIGWNAAFTLLYEIYFRDDLIAKSEPFKNWVGMSFTLQNAFNPLALFSEKNIVSVHSMSSFFLALIQTLGSLSILTVFILTIRTRFRRGGGGAEN